jgi:hypothetical protein
MLPRPARELEFEARVEHSRYERRGAFGAAVDVRSGL